MIDVLRTIISQYSTAPTLCGMIVAADAALDPREDIDDFYRSIWLLDTAFGRGLDIWGRIVAVSRKLRVPQDTSGGDFVGFVGTGYFPFDANAPWYNGDASVNSQVVTMSDDAYRFAILVKAMINISACDAPSINAVLREMFKGRGDAYVVDLGGMNMNFVFKFQLKEYELALLTKSDIAFRPAGVGIGIVQSFDKCFGFHEMNSDTNNPNEWTALPFDEGVFMPVSLIIP